MKALNEEKAPPFDMPPVEPPSFPNRVFDVRDWRAVDDGETVNTVAFRQAVEACHESGGGVVLIPAGNWLTGPIHLRSNVTCERVGVAVDIRGPPEQPVSDVNLEQAR